MPEGEGSTPSAREFVDELNALFQSTDFTAIRTTLEEEASLEQARQTLGRFQEFLERSVDPDLVIDYSQVEAGDRIPGDEAIYHGWEGWLQHWRIWFEAWDAIETDRREVEEIDHERVLLWSVGRVVGRGSGAELPWNSAFTVYTVRAGKLVRMDAYSSRDQALQAAAQAA